MPSVRRASSFMLESVSKIRHSLASVELSSWASRGHNRRGVTLAPFGATLSPTEVSSRSEILQAISSSIIHLFQRKPLKENELGSLQEHVRFLINAEAGALVSEYYKEQLLRKGTIILREKIKNEQGLDLLRMLSETWEYFFREILPSLQAVLYPLASILRNDESIRSLSLLAFRNIVVLKVNLKEALDSVEKALYPPGIKQMLLVLQGIQDNVFLSENQFLLEKLVARVVSPFLGQRGVYEGGPEPVIKVKLKPIPFNIPTTQESDGGRLQVQSLHFQSSTSKPTANPLPSGLDRDRHTSSHNYAKDIKKLNPVLERVATEGNRRHSVVS